MKGLSSFEGRRPEPLWAGFDPAVAKRTGLVSSVWVLVFHSNKGSSQTAGNERNNKQGDSIYRIGTKLNECCQESSRDNQKVVSELHKTPNLRNKKAQQGAPGITTRNKNLIGAKGIATSNKCLTSSNKKLLGAPGLTTRSKDATNGAKGIATNGARGLILSSNDFSAPTKLSHVLRPRKLSGAHLQKVGVKPI